MLNFGSVSVQVRTFFVDYNLVLLQHYQFFIIIKDFIYYFCDLIEYYVYEYYRFNYRTSYFFGDRIVSSIGDKSRILFGSQELVDFSFSRNRFYGSLCMCGRFDYFNCARSGCVFFFLEYIRSISSTQKSRTRLVSQRSRT